MKIFVNPGHSCKPGEDPGTCHFGLRECDIALAIGELTAKYLRNAGCEVKLFQADELAAITDASNYWNADLFVSIHCNSADNVEAMGTETYSYYNSVTGRKLAGCIHDQIVESIPIGDRGIKTAGFYVIRHTHCPAVLVETAFLSNGYDADILITKQDDFARAIARGVTDFLQSNPIPDAWG